MFLYNIIAVHYSLLLSPKGIKKSHVQGFLAGRYRAETGVNFIESVLQGVELIKDGCYGQLPENKPLL